MDQKTRLIVIGAASLLVFAAIAGAVVYLSRATRDNNTTATETNNSNSFSQLPAIPAASSPAPTGTPSNNTAANTQTADFKILQTTDFNLRYPQNWGTLICSNSANFEFDPVSGADSKNVACDSAVKPVTVLVLDKLTCPGETVKIGSYSVVKAKITDQNGDIDYRWCVTVGGKGLDISHRVSASGSKATSKDDFSAQIEQIITNLQPAVRGS